MSTAGSSRVGNEPVVPGFRVLTVIGRGATSTVYAQLNRWVALKVFLADAHSDPDQKRFRREREITTNLGKHPHIEQVLGSGSAFTGLPRDRSATFGASDSDQML